MLLDRIVKGITKTTALSRLPIRCNCLSRKIKICWQVPSNHPHNLDLGDNGTALPVPAIASLAGAFISCQGLHFRQRTIITSIPLVVVEIIIRLVELTQG